MDVSRWVGVGRPRNTLGYAVAVLGTAAITAPLLGVRGDVSKTNVVLAYLLVVTASAAAGGLGPGITAAALGFLAFDVLFLPPYNTLVVTDLQDYLSLGVYLLVALVVSLLVGISERRRGRIRHAGSDGGEHVAQAPARDRWRLWGECRGPG